MSRLLAFIVVSFSIFVYVDGFSFSLVKKDVVNEISSLMDVYSANVVSDYYGSEYRAIISLGTPLKSFSVIMDSGSDVLWLPHIGCRNKGRRTVFCPNNRVYDESKSRTGKKIGSKLKINYGIGSVEGVYMQDVFAFGNGSDALKLKQPIIFGAADTTIDGDQGILGLSFTSYKEQGTNIFEQAVKDGLMDAPIFTVYYTKCPARKRFCNNAGVITFGKHDSQNCGPVIGWAPILPNSSHWKFHIDSLQVGNYKYQTRTEAITDTGCSNFQMGKTVFKAVMKAIGAVPIRGKKYKVTCNRKVSIKLEINGNWYEIPLDAMSREIGNDQCELWLLPNDNDDRFWNLGDPFIKSLCQVHDWENRRVGFALPKNSQPTNKTNKKQLKRTKKLQRRKAG